jgi:serine/threonine-protein kinase
MPHAPDLSGCALDGRYELHAVIGVGAFGRVYRGRDRRLERPVAIKLIKPWWAEDPDWERSFEREARLLARVSDPGIVQIFDVGHAPEGLYYVSELVDGESLAVRLRQGPLPAWDAAEVAEELACALGHAHAQGVVHRDVKPANILISSEGHVKVGDFGVARLAETSTDGASATVVGTPRYMAPEQARGHGISPATDIYSVGIVLYEMLAGRPPFNERAAVELALRHLSDPPAPLPRSTPAPLRAIAERALAKAPSQRYRDGAEMAAALTEARRHAPVKARTGVVRGARPRQRSHVPSRWPTPVPAIAPGAGGSKISAGVSGAKVPAGVTSGGGGSRIAAGTPRAGGSSRQLEPLQPPSLRASALQPPPAQRPPLEAAPLQPPPAQPSPDAAGSRPPPAPTRPAPRMSARRNVNPSGRRRAAGALGLAFLLLAMMIVGAVLVGSTGHVRMPRLIGLRRGEVKAKARRLSLQPKFSWRYDSARKGTVVDQRPPAGRRLADGSTIGVVLSAGPPPVRVPQLAGDSTAQAQSELAHAGLQSRVSQIVAPGVPAGAVTSQSPAPGAKIPRGSRVHLNVAEVPHWQPLASFSGGDSPRTLPFHARGTKWRVVYTMGYRGTCTFVIFCSGPSAELVNASTGASLGSFGLSDGGRQEHVVQSGSGSYRVTVSPGNDSTHWSMWIEDYY